MRTEDFESWYDGADESQPIPALTEAGRREATRQTLWKAVRNHSIRQQQRVFVSRLAMAGAAVLILATALGLLFLRNTTATETYYTESGQSKTLTLPDGTSVRLNGGTEVSFSAKQWDRQRQLQLVRGELFLDVITNPDVPFTVITSDIRINVLGTSFNVRHYPDEYSPEVSVRSGRVQVVTHDGRLTSVLGMGDKVVYHPDSGRFTTLRISPEESGGWASGRYVYRDESLRRIIRDLEQVHHITIHVTDPGILNQRYNIDLTGIPLEGSLQKLQLLGGLRHTAKGDTLLLMR